MIRKAKARILRFKQAEDGNPTVEFVLLFPLLMGFIVSAVEYSFVTMQQTMLERSVDLVVRDIRLGTGSSPTHDSIKKSICDKALVIQDCENNMRLEMIVQDAFTGINLPAAPDCTDNSEEVKPVRSFKNGLSNELMILRACAMINPLIPTSVMGRALVDDTGQIALTATTAFVQEP